LILYWTSRLQVKLSILSDYENTSGPDLANASYDNVSFSTAAIDGNIFGIDFKPDGTRMYLGGRVGANFYQVDLSTAWDLSTASYNNVSFSVASQNSNINDITLSPDGTKVFFVPSNDFRIYRYDLSTPWDLSTASYNQSSNALNSNPQISEVYTFKSIQFKPDGSEVYLLTSDKVLHKATLNTPWNLTTIAYSNVNVTLSEITGTSENMKFNSDGTKIWVNDYAASNGKIYEYSLGTAYDITTLTYNQVYQTQHPYITSAHIDLNQGKMYITSIEPDNIYQYNISSAPSGNTTPTVTWPESITWETGSAPTLPALGQTDVLEFYTSDGGTTYYGKLKEDNVS
jgi:hypothetical protein